MPNSWGRPPYHDNFSEIKKIILWVVIIGVGLFLLFPDFFQNIYHDLIEHGEEGELSEVAFSSDGTNYNSSEYGTSDYPFLYSHYPQSGNEVSSGYWIIFVGGGAFKQLSVNYETYNFLHNLIQSDKNASPSQTVILVANGQILKYDVSEEIYDIIDNIATINGRMIEQG